MSHLPFTLTAYLLNAVAVTIDKYIITQKINHPLVYVFYFSIFSCLALFLIPFTKLPNLNVLFLASSSTLLWTTGAYFMLWALKEGKVSRVIPVIGTLVPIFLLIPASLSGTINTSQALAVSILVLGLIIITLTDWRGEITTKEIGLELASAFFFAISYVVLREAYLQDSFLTVLAYSRMVLIPVGIFIILIPFTRRIVLISSGPKLNFFSRTGALFLIGQAAGGIQELLLTFSVSLANPALVNSLQGFQYIFLFFLNLILSKKLPETYKENYKLPVLATKITGILLIGAGLYILKLNI